jgi:xyloglucan-specific endo-beta-1,4-glucanase
MQLLTFILALLALVNLTFGAPRNTKAADSTECGQWDLITAGSFTLYQDLWNMNEGSGSQCTAVDSLSNNGNTLAWHTQWSWTDGSTTPKSYANDVRNLTSKPLNQFSSISSSWAYRYHARLPLPVPDLELHFEPPAAVNLIPQHPDTESQLYWV